MATLGGGEGEPLDGENDPYRSDGEGGEYDASTTDGNEEPVAVAAQFPRRDLRESLGFLRATRRLALPGAGFDEESDDGSVVALAAVDVFGLLLVSSATGVCIFEKGRSPPQTARHPRRRKEAAVAVTAAPGDISEPSFPSGHATMLLLDCY